MTAVSLEAALRTFAHKPVGVSVCAKHSASADGSLGSNWGVGCGGGRRKLEYEKPTHHNPKYSPKWSRIKGATAISGDGTVLLEITAEGLRSLLKTASPIFTAVFEAMLLQQYMQIALRTKA